jgi:hypothetical protein
VALVGCQRSREQPLHLKSQILQLNVQRPGT